jgi:hypothetical protein
LFLAASKAAAAARTSLRAASTCAQRGTSHRLQAQCNTLLQTRV